jgi:hypothetical protein
MAFMGMKRLAFFVSVGILMTMGGMLGCTPSDQFPTMRAEGTVTLNGKPLSDAHVWLLPKEKNHQEAVLVVRPQGRTGRDGKFVLTTYLQDDGAPAGEYDAVILHGDNDPDAAAEDTKGNTGKLVVPMKYKDAKTSGLIVTIKAGDANVIPLDLKSK